MARYMGDIDDFDMSVASDIGIIMEMHGAEYRLVFRAACILASEGAVMRVTLSHSWGDSTLSGGWFSQTSLEKAITLLSSVVEW